MENSVKIHTPVLVEEIIFYLDLKPDMNIIDATMNGGGHSKAILEKVGPTGMVLGIEIDSQIFQEFKSGIRNSKFENNLILVNDSYVNIKNIVREHDFRPDGILFDLGLSSWHYEKSGRGFSFKREEPLDMRYSPTELGNHKTQITNHKLTAAEIVNTYNREDLEKILREYGEEQFSKNIAKNIVSERKNGPITMTSKLVEIIGGSVPTWYRRRKIHFATKTFQALRIEVNEELKNVEKGVSDAIDVLKPSGRLAVIAFHGLEDKIIRELFKKKSAEGIVKFVVKGTIRPKWEEIKNNPRARSAKLKIVQKIK